MEIARLGFSAFVLAMFASFSAYSQQYYYSDQSAQAQASPYQSAQYYPNRPLPKPYTDYTRSPVMSDDMAYSLKGYRTPNKYYIPPSVPKVVYAPNGLAIPDYAVQDNRDDPGVKYFMSVAYSQNKFTGTGMANDYIDYPMNNESGRSLGDGITTSFAFGAISRSGIRAEVFFSNLTGLRYGFNGIAAYDQTSFNEFDDFGDFFYDQYDDLLYVEGGSIDSQAIGMNIFIPLGDFIGSLFDGTITPYIGAGFGVSYNKVADYYVYDEMGFAEVPLDDSGLPFDPEYFDDLSGYYEWDGWLTHFGATTKSTMWNLELGVEVSVNKKTKLDFYVKQSSFGIVKSKGDVEATYEATSILYPDPEEVDEFGEPLCTLDAEDEGYWYNPDTGWCELDLGPSTTYINDAPPEEGRIQNTEMGVRLRVIF